MPISGKASTQALRAALAAMPEIVRDEMADATRTTASEMKRIARAKCPVDTGTLRDHIDFSFSKAYLRAKVGITPGIVWVQGHVPLNARVARDLEASSPGILKRQGARAYNAAHYAHLVEYGGRSGQMPARPFLGPAFDDQLSPYDDRMRRAQNTSVDRVLTVSTGLL